MKHLLNGLGIAAVIAIAAPALGQASTTSGSSSSGATSVQLAQAAAQSPGKARPQRPARKAQAAQARGGGAAIFGPTSGNNVANELNRMELQRLQAGPAAPMMAPPPPPMAPGAAQPGLSTSSSTYIPPSQPGPVSTADPSAMGPRSSGGGYIPAPTGPVPMPPPPPIAHPVR